MRRERLPDQLRHELDPPVAHAQHPTGAGSLLEVVGHDHQRHALTVELFQQILVLQPDSEKARQNPKNAWIIFDNATKKHMEEKGPDYQYFIFGAVTIPDIDGQFAQAIAAGNKGVFVADTIEELAAKTGIDPKGLLTTVDAYNGYCDKGHDDLFAKDPKFLLPVREPKFYAIKGICCAYQTIGGIRVNGKTEALTVERKVIPGLYGAGDIIAAEIFGDPPVNGVGTLGFAISSGLIAAETALESMGSN